MKKGKHGRSTAKARTHTIISMIDQSPWQFPVVPASKKYFERGKCWTFYCSNPIWFVHLNVRGRADYGQCYCCAESRAYEYFAKKIPVRGRWVMPQKGKPVEWRLDEKRISFAPIK